MAARGIDALVVFGDAGPAVLPALTSVYKAGKVVVPYRVEVGGEAGKNYTKFVGASFKNDGVSWGNWIKSILPKRRQPAVPQRSGRQQPGQGRARRSQVGSRAEYKFINPAPFDVTNWDPALTQQVLTAEIAKNPKIDVIVSDFGPSLVGALPAVQEVQPVDPGARHFGRQHPRMLLDGQPQGQSGLQAVHGRDRQRQRAPGRAMGRRQGDRRRDSRRRKSSRRPTFEDSVSGKPSPVQCRKDLPGDIYLSAQMKGEDQAKPINK